MKKQIFILLLLLSSVIANATTYYVSSSGLDSNNGTSIATPFLTLSKVNSLNLQAGDQVLFKKGDTFYGTLNITKSGSIGNVITYGSYGTGLNPVISGFTSVTSWANLGGNIWESTNAVTSLSTLNMVALNGVNTPMGKYPNSGYFTYQSNATTSITSSDLDGAINWTGAELMVRCNYYFQQRATITSQSGSTINFSNSVSLANGSGFWIQNDIRTLDAQNEWYFNPTTKKIRIYSTSQPSSVNVASVQYLVHFSNTNSPTSYVTIKGIDLIGANDRGIFRWSFGLAENRAHHLTIDNCNISFCGINGISIRGNYTTVTNCLLSDINGNGINVGSSAWNIIESNTINNIGLNLGMIQTSSEFYYGSTNAINTQSTQNSSISYNTITNCGYNGINFGGQTTRNTIIKNNEIDNYCVVTGDGGGIYGSYHSSAIIDGNIISNGIAPIAGTNQSFAQAVGIYLDDNTDTCEVKNNTVYNISCYGLQYNSTSNINTHHNTVYASGRNELRLQRWSGELPLVNNDFSYNKFITKSASQKVISVISYEDDIPTFGVFDHNYYVRPLDNTTIISVNQPSTGSSSYTLAQWKTFSSQDANSLGSPITVSSDDDIYFYYNPTNHDSTVVLTQPGMDVTGQLYSSPITLSPYSSIVIIRDNSNGTYYYISSSSGNDSNAGTLDAPWASLTKVNSASLVAKDRVLFKYDDSWYGQLVPKSGSALGDIVYSSYGTGTNKPLIHASSIITGASNWTNHSGNIWKNSDPTLNNTELLVNADDANNFSSVLYQANSPAVGTKTIDTGTYHSGTSSIKIACTGTGNVPNSMYLQYTGSFAMIAGKSYEFSFWTYGTSSGQIDEAWALTTSWGEIDKLQSAKTFPATTWTKMTYRFTAQNDYAACMFLVRFGLGITSGNSIYFDDFSFKEITGFYPNIEVCNLIFNNDRSFGKRKWSIGTLTSQGDWYWDGTNKVLYLYSNGIPSNVYQSIRTVNKLNLISASSKSYITIDGLALKYGDYGFVGTNTDHVTIKNCDIAYIGGSDAGSPVRKGNGIEFWASNSNALVQNNKIWECFDAGITSQSSVVSTVISNMTFKNNQVWNCEYGYEYFNTGSGSSTSNILVENNTFYNSGAGWGHSQRSDPTGYSIRLANRTEATHSNFVIRNNIFSNSTAECQHNWDTTHNLYTINNNLYYQPTGNIVGINFTYYYNQAQFSTYKSATGWDANSITGNPKFIGKDIGDFRLLPTSPARKVGYQGLDIGALPYTNSTISKTGIINKKIYAF